MTKPSNFILTTDFPTLKNQTSATGTATVPGSIVIAGNDWYGLQADAAIGSIGSLSRGRVSSSKNGNIKYVGHRFEFTRTGTVLGSPAPYSVFAFIYRVSPSALRFQIYIPNPYSDPLTTEAGSEDITMYATTFVAPYA